MISCMVELPFDFWTDLPLSERLASFSIFHLLQTMAARFTQASVDNPHVHVRKAIEISQCQRSLEPAQEAQAAHLGMQGDALQKYLLLLNEKASGHHHNAS